MLSLPVPAALNGPAWIMKREIIALGVERSCDTLKGQEPGDDLGVKPAHFDWGKDSEALGFVC